MGRKISVDSASMMNKGLELIEACWLFDARPAQVEVVIHPQSVIHSLVDYVDGSVLAQLGNPDMRTPIANALAWPERIDSGVAPLDLFGVARLDFQRPDEQRFPCLRLARQAAEAGGCAPARHQMRPTKWPWRRFSSGASAFPRSRVSSRTLWIASLRLRSKNLDAVLGRRMPGREPWPMTG